ARGGIRRQHRSGHLGDRDPGRRGQLGELAGGFGRGQAEAFHERATGHRDDRLPRGRGPDLVQDPALVLDDRGQPQHVVFATGHTFSPPRTAYRYSVNAHKPVATRYIQRLPGPAVTAEDRHFHTYVLLLTFARPMIVTSGLPSVEIARRCRAGIAPHRHSCWERLVTDTAQSGPRLDKSGLEQLLAGLTAVRGGDFSTRLDTTGEPLMDEIATVFNGMADQLDLFTSEVTRVAREVGTEGKLGGQAYVPGVSGTWKALTDSVNAMAGNLTGQVRNIAQVATAVAKGDLSQKIDVDARGEILELKSTLNTMVDQLSSFADEVTRVAREVGTQGNLGGQAVVRGVSGTWKDLTDNVNVMASNLTAQDRSIAQVATAVERGDLSQQITVEAKGEVAALAQTINRMVGTLSAFADEVTRVAREVGTEGRLGGQADVKGVAGTWKDLTDNVNSMADNLTSQVRNIAQVTTAVAQGDLSKKIDVAARGEILELKSTLNTMVDQLSSFAAEVTRVAREVGSQGRLGGQAEVEGVSGTWKRLTENVNELAGNLTRQVRAIAEVTSAVASGDLTRSISVEAQGEVAELKDNINAMVQSLRETIRANQQQDWLKTNLAQIAGMMQGHRDLAVVAELIMDELAPLVGG